MPLVVLGDWPVEGLGTVVGGLEARAVLVPPLPKPQDVQFDGDQPPVDWQPLELARIARPAALESTHRESITRMARTSLSKSAPAVERGG